MATTKDPMFVVMRRTVMFGATINEPVFVFDTRLDAREYAKLKNAQAKKKPSKYLRTFSVKRVLPGPTFRKK
jgi:hypothetical protein